MAGGQAMALLRECGAQAKDVVGLEGGGSWFAGRDEDARSDHSTCLPETPRSDFHFHEFSRLSSAEEPSAPAGGGQRVVALDAALAEGLLSALEAAASRAASPSPSPARHKVLPPSCRPFWVAAPVPPSQLLERRRQLQRCRGDTGVVPALKVDLWRLPVAGHRWQVRCIRPSSGDERRAAAQSSRGASLLCLPLSCLDGLRQLASQILLPKVPALPAQEH